VINSCSPLSESPCIRATGVCLGLTVLSSMVLSVLLVTGRVEQNSGPIVEVENIIRVYWMQQDPEVGNPM
jgi:hypothetical protein